MNVKSLFLIPFLTCGSCGEQAKQTDPTIENTVELADSSELNEQEAEINNLDSTTLPERVLNQPEMILGQAEGDLDKDGVAEKVVVFSRDLEWESATPRDLVIYKQKDGIWEEWVETENAILHADEGGMMGDPFFGDIYIVNGILEISHAGGSSWKWGHTDKYRYQDGEFYLIGYESNYGKPCEYWGEYDYNLSTGDCNFLFEVDVDEDSGCGDFDAREEYGEDRQEKFNHKMKELPKLTNRRGLNYEFKSPKGEDIYL